MKRLMIIVLVMMAPVMGATTKASARTGAWHFYDGGYHWVDYGRSYGHIYSSRPVVQVGVGYGYDYDYGYGYGYSRGPAGYPTRSLLDALIGDTDRKAQEIQEKELDFRHEQQRTAVNRETNREIFADVNQRGKIQHLEDANQRLQQENAELRKELSEIKEILQKLLAEKGK